VSLFDDLLRQAKGGPPTHIQTALRKVWGHEMLWSSEGAENFTDQGVDAWFADHYDRVAVENEAIKAMRDSTRRERTQRTKLFNKALREAGLDPVHFKRLVIRHHHLTPEQFERLITQHLALPPEERNEHSKSTHHDL